MMRFEEIWMGKDDAACLNTTLVDFGRQEQTKRKLS
jgi:hypothetical protein